MPKSAVLLDLFGTIVPGFSSSLYDENLFKMATVLEVEFEPFKKRWLSDTPNRGIGKYKDVRHVIHEYTGMSIDDARVLEAEILRLEMTSRSLVPKNETLQALSELKGIGMKLALVSNCSQETPELFLRTEMAPFFDSMIFSSRVGVMKPKPDIYHMALDSIGVKPEDAIFVGDGDSDELAGAKRVGISPILIDTGVPDSFKLSSKRETADIFITSLLEIKNLI